MEHKQIKTFKTQQHFFDFTNKRVEAMIIGVDALLYEIKQLSNDLQEDHGFIDKKYISILRHIKFMFRVEGLLKEHGDEVGKFKDTRFENYIKMVGKKDFPRKCIDDLLAKSVRVYLTDFMQRFIDITGYESEDCSKIETYEAFLEKFKKFNEARNPLFDLMYASMEFKKGRFVNNLPQFSDKVNQQYRLFVELVKSRIGVEACKGKDIASVIYQLNDNNSLFELFVNFGAMKCVFPTSCSVESIFSFMKYAETTNTTIQNLDKKLTTILDIRTDREDFFN